MTTYFGFKLKEKNILKTIMRISKGYDAGKKAALDNILLPDELRLYSRVMISMVIQRI
jgi:hypothetical protein